MHNSFTDGTVQDLPDMCSHCQMTTGGRHEETCPLFEEWKNKRLLEIRKASFKRWDEAYTYLATH